MPIPSLESLCIECLVPPQGLCVTMPGGIPVCASHPMATPPTASEVAGAMFAQLNSALAPLAPVFNIIDAIAALAACAQAVPKSIKELDPTEITKCIPDLVEKVSKLMSLVPVLSIPVMIKDIINVIIAFLEGLKSELEGAKLYLEAIAAAQLKAAQPGNGGLLSAISCAQSQYSAYMQNIGVTATPLNRLMGTLNAFLALVPGVDPLPCLGSMDGLPDVLVDTLTTLVDVLKIARSVLPGGLKIVPYAPKGVNC